MSFVVSRAEEAAPPASPDAAAQGVQDPPDVREAIRAFRPGSPGRRWSFYAVALASASAVAATTLVGFPPALRPWAAGLALVLAPLAAAAACLGAREAAAPEGRATWLLLAVAALLGAMQQAHHARMELAGAVQPFPSMDFHLMVAFHVALAQGGLLALRPAQEARLASEIALDGILVLLAASAVVLRLALDEPLIRGLLGLPQAVAVLVGQVAVAASLFFVALLVFWRDTSLNGAVVDGLLVAVGFFALGNLPITSGLTEGPDSGGVSFDLIRAAGWLALFLTAGLAMARPGPSPRRAGRDVAARRFRQLIIPGAAVFLATWAVDAARRTSVTNTSRVVVALLGLTLAARIGTALYAVEQESLERRRAEERAARARLRAVTAQMNPHFMFNALHSLSALVRRDPRGAERSLERLGGLLRYGLDSEDELVTLEEEWAFAQDFLEMEALRLGPRLRTLCEVEPDALGVLVPPFVIQPLVENAVRYAVSPDPLGSTVEVRAFVRGERLLVEVRDHGPGASDLRLQEATGVGVRGVRAQLEAHYGQEARLDVEHPEDGGLLLRLVIPADRD